MGDQVWHQGSPGVEGECEAYDRFGDALATGDFSGDGIADLAVGVPYEDVDATRSAALIPRANMT